MLKHHIIQMGGSSFTRATVCKTAYKVARSIIIRFYLILETIFFATSSAKFTETNFVTLLKMRRLTKDLPLINKRLLEELSVFSSGGPESLKVQQTSPMVWPEKEPNTDALPPGS